MRAILIICVLCYLVLSEENYIVLNNKESVRNFFQNVQPDEIVLVAGSVNILTNPYIAPYYHWCIQMLTHPGYKLTSILVDATVENRNFLTNVLLDELPRQSLVISVDFNHTFPNIADVANCKMKSRQLGLNKCQFSFIHLNHEFPLNFSDYFHTFKDANEVTQLYRDIACANSRTMRHNSECIKDSYIFRNYVAPYLSDLSEVFPLGPNGLQYIFAKYEIDASLPVASERSNYCGFRGRLLYINDNPKGELIHYFVDDRTNMFKAALALSEETDPYDVNQFPCAIEDVGSANLRMNASLLPEDHLVYISNTVFSLIPAGNNFETFRLYEALEMGSIPIFMLSFDEKHYMRMEFWDDYPGPIFTTWDAAFAYLSSVYYSDNKYSIINELQRVVYYWYHFRFKPRVQAKIASHLMKMLDNNSTHIIKL